MSGDITIPPPVPLETLEERIRYRVARMLDEYTFSGTCTFTAENGETYQKEPPAAMVGHLVAYLRAIGRPVNKGDDIPEDVRRRVEERMSRQLPPLSEDTDAALGFGPR